MQSDKKKEENFQNQLEKDDDQILPDDVKLAICL